MTTEPARGDTRTSTYGPTIWDALSAATDVLEDVSESPQFDAELLLREVLGIDRTALFLRYDQPLDPSSASRFAHMVERRRTGESVAYVLGRRGFRAIELFVDQRVLVPRPETERFVDYALDWLRRHPGPRRIVDVGTGSGAIALALASELGARRPDVTIVATERYRPALEVVAINRRSLGLQGRVSLIQADLLAGLRGPFDIILANLPYLRDDQQHPSIAHEPNEALYGGPDGFDHYRRLFAQIHDDQLLATGALLVGEIDPDQADIALAEAQRLLGLAARVDADTAGLARYVVIES